MKIPNSQILFWLVLLAIDLLVFMGLGLLMMGYDDSYDPSKGAYWSLESMNSKEKVIYLVYNFWIFLHLAGLLYGVFKAGKKLSKIFNG